MIISPHHALEPILSVVTPQQPYPCEIELTQTHHIIHRVGLEGGEGVVPAGGEGLDHGHRDGHLGPVPRRSGPRNTHVLNLA